MISWAVLVDLVRRQLLGTEELSQICNDDQWIELYRSSRRVSSGDERRIWIYIPDLSRKSRASLLRVFSK
jgi:hypothetical protein